MWMQPLKNGQPFWLIPIGALIMVMSTLTIYLASRRDLGDSIVADADSAKPHTNLLARPFSFALRLTRTADISLVLATGFIVLSLACYLDLRPRP